MVYFVGAGSGAPDLITVRGLRLLQKADVVIYAGSLVNPEILKETKEGCKIYDSAKMHLEQVLNVMENAEKEGFMTVRLHTGDPCLYGAIREQMDALDQMEIAYEYCPGVSAFCAAAASLNLEYTLPDISQSVIISRMEGRTSVPEKERLRLMASHQATMVLFLSAGMMEDVQRELIAGGYNPKTPAAIVYKASWPEEKTIVCTLDTLAETGQKEGIYKTALIIVGDVVQPQYYDKSKLYDKSFETEFRKNKSL